MAGIVTWLAVVTGVSLALRAGVPALAADLAKHATMTALWERLAISFLGSLLGGLVAALVSGERMRAPLIAGVLLLLWWGTYHVTMIWNQFPVWYHLTFFVSLVLLSVLGGRLRRA
ncbi:MAG TPA: hypothetical protein VMU08_02125 [Rhizomicrobium sp.]|nr:hypothetical protein [Rhizomicrobium sp.]